MTFRISSLLLCATLAIPALGTAQGRKKQAIPKPQLGEVTIDQFRDLLTRPAESYFKSDGPVRIILEDAVTHEQTVLLADDAEGTANGEIRVRGAVRVQRADGTLTGRSLAYSADTQTGSVLSATVDFLGLTMRGDKVELLPGRVIRATNASFTTCMKKNPDYHITARSLSVGADKKVKARNVTFYLGRVRLVTLPSFQKSFSRGGGSGVPLPGYSKETGPHMRFADKPIEDANLSLEYNITVSALRTPSGIVAYERDLGRTPEDAVTPRIRVQSATDPLRGALYSIEPPLTALRGGQAETPRRTSLYALLVANTFVYTRKREDLRVSRLPEVGIEMQNLSNRDVTQRKGVWTDLFDPRYWRFNAEAGFGYVREQPTNADAGRFGVRMDAASAFVPMGPFRGQIGTALWGNLYTRGGAYGLVSPEVSLDYLFGHTQLIGAAYRYTEGVGATPFQFDRRDVRHEARARYAYIGGPWLFDFGIDFDVERKRAYDTTFSIRRRTDCLEYGLGWRARGSGLTFLLNLLPAPRPAKTTGP